MERILELGILSVAAMLAVRILMMPAARRELREQPRHTAFLVVVSLATLAVVAWAAARSPIVLRSMAIAAVVCVAFFAWRSRPGFGRSRSRPPGSLGLKSSLDAIVDRSFYADQFRRHGPVFKMAQFHQPVVCIVDLKKGRELLKREAESLVLTPLPISAEIPRGFIRYMKPDDYAVYLKLFRSAFSEGVLDANRDFIHDTVRRGLVELVAATNDQSGGVDPREIMERLLLTSLLRIYFGDGITPDDGTVIEACCRDIGSDNPVGRAGPSARLALRMFNDQIRERSAERSFARSDPPSVWSEVLRRQPDAATDPTATGNLILLLEASRDSIGGLLVWILRNLADAPASIEMIRAAEERAAAVEDAVVLESLRLAQSEYVYRKVVKPVEFESFVIPEGWFTRICVAEAHRRDPPFDRPEVFDPTRFVNRRFSRDEFSPFGLDHHACLGAPLTMVIGRAFVRVLACEFDVRLMADGPPERGNRHWNHWRPSSKLRVALSRRDTSS